MLGVIRLRLPISDLRARASVMGAINLPGLCEHVIT